MEKRDGKNQVYALVLAYPTTWEQHWATESRTFEKNDGHKVETEPFYEDDLKQRWPSQWESFKAMGKFEETTDREGTPMWEILKTIK